ncbi:hypothetical protein DsansV1_C26g0193111 [Dioscorea sansibarensis]
MDCFFLRRELQAPPAMVPSIGNVAGTGGRSWPARTPLQASPSASTRSQDPSSSPKARRTASTPAGPSHSAAQPPPSCSAVASAIHGRTPRYPRRARS